MFDMNAIPQTDPDKPAFSIDQFCDRWEIGRTKFYEEVRKGRLRIFKIGKLTRVTPDAEADWQRQLEEQSAEAAAEWRLRIKEQTSRGRNKAA